MLIRHFIPTAVAAALLIPGCQLIGCPDIGHFGVSLEAVDAASGETLPGPASMTIRSDGFEEVVALVRGPGDQLMGAGAFEREGVFDVRVSHPGYDDWTAEDVAVQRRGGCDVLNTAHLVARMEPLE